MSEPIPDYTFKSKELSDAETKLKIILYQINYYNSNKITREIYLSQIEQELTKLNKLVYTSVGIYNQIRRDVLIDIALILPNQSVLDRLGSLKNIYEGTKARAVKEDNKKFNTSNKAKSRCNISLLGKIKQYFFNLI